MPQRWFLLLTVSRDEQCINLFVLGPLQLGPAVVLDAVWIHDAYTISPTMELICKLFTIPVGRFHVVMRLEHEQIQFQPGLQLLEALLVVCESSVLGDIVLRKYGDSNLNLPMSIPTKASVIQRSFLLWGNAVLRLTL